MVITADSSIWPATGCFLLGIMHVKVNTSIIFCSLILLYLSTFHPWCADSCILETGFCVNNDDCCTGLVCDGNKCTTCTQINTVSCDVTQQSCCSGSMCRQSGGCDPCTISAFCDQDSDCQGWGCSNTRCVNDSCSPFTCSTVRGAICTNNSDCCEGLVCIPIKGSDKKKCMVREPYDKSCSVEGQDCVSGFVCEEYSGHPKCRICAGHECSNDMDCQFPNTLGCGNLKCSFSRNQHGECTPPTICKIEGETCVNNTYCCTGLYCSVKESTCQYCKGVDSQHVENYSCCESLYIKDPTTTKTCNFCFNYNCLQSSEPCEVIGCAGSCINGRCLTFPACIGDGHQGCLTTDSSCCDGLICLRNTCTPCTALNNLCADDLCCNGHHCRDKVCQHALLKILTVEMDSRTAVMI